MLKNQYGQKIKYKTFLSSRMTESLLTGVNWFVNKNSVVELVDILQLNRVIYIGSQLSHCLN